VVLLFVGKAERVEDTAQVMRSPSTVVTVPSVIRLHHFVRQPVARLSFNKNILKRDVYTCQYCGRNGGERMTIDHVIPKSPGTHGWENVVSACRACNLKKGNKSPGEVGLRLLRKPTRPRSASYLGILAYASHHYECWRKYLPAEAGESSTVGNC
jgi:5-methylcytosine-specific restriction endonuclease McrA